MPAIHFLGNGALSGAMSSALARAGYDVTGSGAQPLRHFPRLPSAIFIETGDDAAVAIDWCRELRSEGYAGAVFLLAERLERAAIVHAFDAGADDCVLPPFDETVIVARLRAVLRRSEPRLPLERPSVEVLPEEVPRVAHLGASRVRLTPIEAQILETLRRARGKFVPTTELRNQASPGVSLSRESLQVHIVHLRRKLNGEAWRLENCRSHGYRFLDVDRAGGQRDLRKP
jgi:DNA-binding response OmpR family regulator